MGYRSVISVLLICFLLTWHKAEGQDLPVYQLYLWEPALINPAVTGCAECAEVKLLDRHQWPGAFKNAPKTQVLTAGKSFSRDKGRSHGLGVQLVNDANGAHHQLLAKVAYSFHITLDQRKNLKLGFGLMPSLYQATYDERDFTPMNDPIITWGVEKEIRPDVSTGLYLYNDRFHVGVSAVQLLEFTSSLNAARNERGYFLHGGMVFSFPGRWDVEPGMTLSYLSRQIQSDLNARLTYQGSYWIMLSYRHQWLEFPGQPSRLLLYAGLQYNNLSFGYGYDAGISSMIRYGYGSHELMISYKFCPSRAPCRVYQ